jgi:ankyrin repeat protein
MVAAVQENLRVAERLLAAGADPSEVDDKGAAPLHKAAAVGAWGTVELLLAAGANVNEATVTGETPLHFAASAQSGEDSIRVIRMLVDAGADPTAENDDGSTPLSDAESFGYHALAKIMRQGQSARESE